MDYYIKKIDNADAHKLLNDGDWEQIINLENDLRKRYNTEKFFIEFYQYKDDPGLISVYKINNKEVAMVVLMADFQEK